jgi:hypothetical protein
MSKEASLTQESDFLARRIGEITDSRTRLEKEREEVRAKMETVLQAAERKRELRDALVEKLREIRRMFLEEQNAMIWNRSEGTWSLI